MTDLTYAELDALDAKADASAEKAAVAVAEYKQWLARKPRRTLCAGARRPALRLLAPLGDADQIRRQSPVTRRGPPDHEPPIRRLYLVVAAPSDAELTAERSIWGAP